MKKKKSPSKILESLKQNYWISATIVLAILLAVSFFSGPSTGAVVSPQVAGASVLQFALNQGADAELVSTTDAGSLYEVILSIQGQEVPVYVTKDGQNLIPQTIPLETKTTTTATTEVPKSENPTSQLYIWSYCPYGVTALTPFAETAKLLGGNMEVILYYAGHGDFEVQQNKIQACIQKLGYENEYWDYAETFASTIYEECYGDIDCDLEKSTELMNTLGINSEAVLTCVEKDGDSLLEDHYKAAQEVGVTGSPSLVINGVKASVARTAEAYKQAICSGYEDAPEACGTELDSTAATSSGSC